MKNYVNSIEDIIRRVTSDPNSSTHQERLFAELLCYLKPSYFNLILKD